MKTHTGRAVFAALGCWIGLVSSVAVAAPEQQTAISVESDTLRLVVGTNARAIGFIDKATGINYADLKRGGIVFARVKRDGKMILATQAAMSEGVLRIGFGDSGIGLSLKLTGVGHSIVVEVLSVTGEGVEECTFVHFLLTLQGLEEEPFAGCALALNLQTQVRRLPMATSLLDALCYPRFGFAGAKVALVGCPQKELRRVLQEVVKAAPELPQSPIGGPWALDAEINRGSYLFAPVSEKNADEWIRLAQSLGITQINFNHMSRYGDAEPYPALYPNGKAGLKAVVDKVHAAGLKAGLHTYAFFIDETCPWVTPVPDPRLGKDATFTLAEALGAEGQTVSVVEPTTNMSAVTGFFVHNSATLQVDDELIVYSGVSKSLPYAFTQCKRGACGTHAAPHDKGAKAHHLKECFGRFAPDPHSTLLAEVAERQAQVINECGFDMMYIDALDGEGVLGGRENGWHYGSLFVFELWKRFDRPVLLEMSTMHHHLWTLRSRIGAWDHPDRSHKRFIDIHCAANARVGRTFLPTHLGWWRLKTQSEFQSEPTFPEDLEYLCCKAIGNDVGFSLMGVNPKNVVKNSAVKRLGGIVHDYEVLRHAKVFPESVKTRLRVPGDEFTLGQETNGAWRLRPARYDKHKAEPRNSESATWVVTNTFERQPLRLRLEALMSAGAYGDTNAVIMASFSDPAEFAETAQAKGVTATWAPVPGQVKAGAPIGVFTASNAGSARSATWARFGKTFTPPLDLGRGRALGVWVHGDAQGEVLNFQLKCPQHVVAGLGEHYVVVDFTGWRYLELIEPEGERYADYVWPYKIYYHIYRGRIDFQQVDKLTVWVNNLPASGTATCLISPVHALPLVKAKIRNPRVSVGGRTLLFPVELESNYYLEFNPPGDCKMFGPSGNFIRTVKVAEDVPVLEAGKNQLQFECDRDPGVNPRVRITTITFGAPLPKQGCI